MEERGEKSRVVIGVYTVYQKVSFVMNHRVSIQGKLISKTSRKHGVQRKRDSPHNPQQSAVYAEHSYRARVRTELELYCLLTELE